MQKYINVLLVSLIILTFAVFYAEARKIRNSITLYNEVKVVLGASYAPIANDFSELDKWREDIVNCESGNDPNAVNEVDLDGTPSIGLWQMKPSTYKGWVKKYEPFPYKHFDEADWYNTLMSRWHQNRVMDEVIADAENINWSHQFPYCTSLYGYPPK